MRKQIRNTLCIFIGLMGFAAMPALAQVDMFLCIKASGGESLKGDSQGLIRQGFQTLHKDCIDVLAWSWGASQSGTTHMGGSGGAGAASFQDISITKYIDNSSDDLLKHVAKGAHLDEFELLVYKSGCQECGVFPTHRIKGEDAIVTSVSSGGSGGEERLTENVSLNFAKYEYCFTPTKENGSADVEQCHKWDIAANMEIP